MPKTSSHNTQRVFTIGDEWLYYKIYCGIKTTNILLLEVIKPLSEHLLKEKLIDKWFFIRYSDPDNHLRVRFHLSDIKNIGKVLLKIKKELFFYLNTHQIWNIQLATYKRELERYGEKTIALAESFFYYDSKKTLNMITSSQNEEERFLCIFTYLENILSIVNFSPTKKTIFFK